MHAVAGDELPKMHAQLVVGIGGNVVKLVHGNQPVVELLDPVFIDGKAKRRVCADQHLVAALKKRPDSLDLTAVVGAGRVAEVPFRLHAPVGPKAEPRQRLIVEARADGLFRHDDDRLLEALILKFVERDKHERAALARRGRRLDEQVLFTALFVGALLHRPHTKRVRFR